MNIYRNYFFCMLLFSFIAAPTKLIIGMESAPQEQDTTSSFGSSIDVQEALKAQESTLDELKSIAEECLQNGAEMQMDILPEDGFALLNNKEKHLATAIFEIPDNPQIHELSDSEKQKIKELFEVYSIETRGQYKIIHFHYKDESLMPENKEQATLLLYAPYTSTENHSSSKSNEDPKKLEKSTTYLKTADKKELFEKIKTKIAMINPSYNEGLIGTTKVKTNIGYIKLEDLKVGDSIACYDFNTAQESYSTVTFIDKLHLVKYVQISINNETIELAHNHKFFIYSTNSWVRAEDLINNVELRYLVDPNIQDVKEVQKELDVIRISVNDKHNFYITNHNILVHNFAVEVSVLWSIGEGIEITWAILGPSLTAAATGLIYWVNSKFKDINKHPATYTQNYDSSTQKDDHFYKADNTIQTPPNSLKNTNGAGSQSPQDPDKDKNNKNRKLPEEIMRDAKLGKKTSNRTKQFEKPGGYQEALEDFEKLKPNNIKEMEGKIGKMGELPDGTRINVRAKSKEGRPTLEIFDPGNKNSVKFRYGNK